MVYLWCSTCASRQCLNEAQHRANKAVGYRADFMLGGQYGKRIRKLFSNKKDAENFEHVTMGDFVRGKFIVSDASKMRFDEFYNVYVSNYINKHTSNPIGERNKLKMFYSLFATRTLNSLSVKDWETYTQKQLDRKINKTSINRYLNTIKSMFNWAVKQKYLISNPLDDAKKFKVHNIRVRWLDDKEIGLYLKRCDELGLFDIKDILIFAMNTGFRKANLERITAHDIMMQRAVALKTKSLKPYDVPINNHFQTVVDRLIKIRPTGPLLNFSNFRKDFRLAIPDETISLHTFRHTFAAQCLKSGIPIDRVCKWLGHHSMEFTRTQYGHLCPNQEAKEIELLNIGESR